jgi:putative colanic acid biosynthesis UDP-glucose lipid carrier transferase
MLSRKKNVKVGLKFYVKEQDSFYCSLLKLPRVSDQTAKLTSLNILIETFLRRNLLDKLPQFFNVLHSDAEVDPRPHALTNNELYRKQITYYMLRHKMKPGITGWAQVSSWRGETDNKTEVRIKYDLHYIRRWSIWFHFKIVIFTIFKGFACKYVY